MIYVLGALGVLSMAFYPLWCAVVNDDNNEGWQRFLVTCYLKRVQEMGVAAPTQKNDLYRELFPEE